MKAIRGQGWKPIRQKPGRVSATVAQRNKPEKTGRGITIVAKTPVGKKAMEEHERSRLKEPWTQRKIFDGLYVEKVECEEPYTITIEHRNEKVAMMIPFESLMVPIKAALLENGAVFGVDYVLEPLGGAK